MRHATLYDLFVLAMYCYGGYRMRRQVNEWLEEKLEKKDYSGFFIMFVLGTCAITIDNRIIYNTLNDIQLK
jgi:hypothetical protein